MQLALLGVDEDARRLAQAAADSSRHHVTVICGVDSDEQLRELAPSATWTEQWESLLDETSIDGVIVAHGSSATRDDQLRKLVQAAVPLLLVQPACEAIVAYELEMIRGDTRGVVVPYVPGRLHPAIQRLRKLVDAGDDSAIGAVEQIVVERSMQDRNRETVLFEFSRDVALIRLLIGEIEKVSTIRGATESDAAWSNLTVSVSSRSDLVARWSAGPAPGEPEARLSLVGPRGKATVVLPRDESEWTLEVGGDKTAAEFAEFDGPAAALEQFAAAIEGSQVTLAWSDACRDLDVTDSVQRSMRRGRTIAMLNETPSEEQTFKGIMAAGGCGILLVVLAVLSIVAVIGGLTRSFSNQNLKPVARGDAERLPIQSSDDDPRAPLLLRIWPVYPLVAFLLLQFLRLVFKPAPEAARDSVAEDSPDQESG